VSLLVRLVRMKTELMERFSSPRSQKSQTTFPAISRKVHSS